MLERRPPRLAESCAFVSLFLALGCQGSAGELFSFSQSLGGAASGDEGQGGAPFFPVDPQETWLRPPANASFQIQLSGTLDLEIEAEFFVVDLESPSDSQFAALKSQGAHVGCYFSSGSYEPFRADAAEFPGRVLGESLPDYPDERWLNVAEPVVLELMIARMERARERGCDAVYPSTVRPDDFSSGFQTDAVTYAAYSSALAQAAHDLALGALYAGGAEVSPEALDYDAALVFGCALAGTCEAWSSVESNGTSIFPIELAEQEDVAEVCALIPAGPWPFIIKEPNLSAFRAPCP